MNIRYILPLIAVAAVVSASPFKSVLRAQSTSVGDAAIEPMPWQRSTGGVGPARRMFARLHLSAEQKRAGLAVLRTRRPAIKPLLDSLTKERGMLRTLCKAPAVDKAAIRAQSARLAGVEADLAVQRAYLVHDLRALATPEQLQTLEEMQSENASRRAEIMQRIDAWIAGS